MVNLNLKYDKTDLYEVLGVDRNASKAQIKSAYRKLAKRYHPDFNDHINAEEVFRDINFAYQTLSDDTKRANYDKYGFKGINGPSVENFMQDIDEIFKSTKITDADLEDLIPKKKKSRRLRKNERNLLDLDDEKESVESASAKTARSWWKKFRRFHRVSKTTAQTSRDQTSANNNANVSSVSENSETSSSSEVSAPTDYTFSGEAAQEGSNDFSGSNDTSTNDSYVEPVETNNDNVYGSTTESPSEVTQTQEGSNDFSGSNDTSTNDSYVEPVETNNDNVYGSTTESPSEAYSDSSDASDASLSNTRKGSSNANETNESSTGVYADSNSSSRMNDLDKVNVDFAPDELLTNPPETTESSNAPTTTDETDSTSAEKKATDSPVIILGASKEKEKTPSIKSQINESTMSSVKIGERLSNNSNVQVEQNQTNDVVSKSTIVATPLSKPDFPEPKEKNTVTAEIAQAQSSEPGANGASIETSKIVTPAVDQNESGKAAKHFSKQESLLEPNPIEQTSQSSPVVASSPVAPVQPVIPPTVAPASGHINRMTSPISQSSANQSYPVQPLEKFSTINSIFHEEPLDLLQNLECACASKSRINDPTFFEAGTPPTVTNKFSQKGSIPRINHPDVPKNASQSRENVDIFAHNVRSLLDDQNIEAASKSVFSGSEISPEADVVVEINVPQLVMYVGDTKDLSYSRKVKCHACRQSRTKRVLMCPLCDGSGLVNENVKIHVKLPITDRNFISCRFFGFGNANAKNDFVGDLIVNFRAGSSSKFFSVDDLGNLYVTVHVDGLKINLERYLKIPTLSGMIKIAMKEINTDEQISIDGYGLREHYSESLKRNLLVGKLIVDLVFEFCNYNVNKSMRVRDLLKLSNPRVEKFEKELEQELKTTLAFKSQSHSWNDFIDKTIKSK